MRSSRFPSAQPSPARQPKFSPAKSVRVLNTQATGDLETAEIKEASQSSDEIEVPRSETSENNIEIMGGRSDDNNSLEFNDSSDMGDHSTNSINLSGDTTKTEESLLGGIEEDDDGKLLEQLLTTLEEGQYFGANTFDEVLKPAPVSAYAAKDLHLLVVEASAMRKLKFIHTERVKFEQFDFMSSIYLFQKLSRTRIHKMGEDFKPMKVHRGQYLFHEKEHADFVYIIKSGEFKITKEIMFSVEDKTAQPTDSLEDLLKIRDSKKRQRMASHKSGWKKEIVEVAIVGVNNVIGEEDAIKNGCFQTSCVCIKQPSDNQKAEVLKIGKERFLKLLRGQVSEKEIFNQIKSKEEKLSYGFKIRNEVKRHMKKRMSLAIKQVNTIPEEDKLSTAEDSDPKLAEGQMLEIEAAQIQDAPKVVIIESLSTPRNLEPLTHRGDFNQSGSALATAREEIKRSKYNSMRQSICEKAQTLDPLSLGTFIPSRGNTMNVIREGDQPEKRHMLLRKKTKIAEISEQIDKDLAFSHTATDRLQVNIDGGKGASLSKKSFVAGHKAMQTLSKPAEQKHGRSGSMLGHMMNSYSTASLPTATVTQTWNINEAMQEIREKKRKHSARPLVNRHKSVNSLSIPMPTPAYLKSTSNKELQKKQAGITITDRMLPDPLKSKYADRNSRGSAFNVNLKKFNKQQQADPKNRGVTLRSNILQLEMMQQTNKPQTANQMKRLQRMKDFAQEDKARRLNLNQLKEATAQIRGGVTDNEKNARKSKEESARAAYLVKTQKVAGFEQLSALTQSVEQTHGTPGMVMGKPQNRQGQSYLYNSHALVRQQTNKVKSTLNSKASTGNIIARANEAENDAHSKMW